MNNIILTKVASAFKDNYQKYNIPIIDKDSFDMSLEHVKEDILTTLINVSSKFNRFKANIMLEIDCSIIKSEPLEIKHGIVDINDIDKLIIDILQINYWLYNELYNLSLKERIELIDSKFKDLEKSKSNGDKSHLLDYYIQELNKMKKNVHMYSYKSPLLYLYDSTISIK